MSIKVNFLHNLLDCFSENLGDVSDEQGKKFHQDIKVMEEWYQEDYCWNLKPHAPDSRKL